MSYLEDLLWNKMMAAGIQDFHDVKAEYKFYPERKWRFDFAIPDKLIGIECEGGTWSRGRHTRGSGYYKDCEKYNTAAINAWCVLRFTKDMIEDGMAIDHLLEAIDKREVRYVETA